MYRFLYILSRKKTTTCCSSSSLILQHKHNKMRTDDALEEHREKIDGEKEREREIKFLVRIFALQHNPDGQPKKNYLTHRHTGQIIG